MAVRARMHVDGLPEAVRRLDEVGLRARRPEPALRSRSTLHDLTASERRRFEDTRGWKRDTPKWVAEKRRLGLDPRILRATGKLAAALESGEGLTFRAYNSTLFWGIPLGRSDLYYAQALAKGVGHAKTKRRMVVIDKLARYRIAIRVEKFITGGYPDDL